MSALTLEIKEQIDNMCLSESKALCQEQEVTDVANNLIIKDSIRIANNPDIQYAKKIADIREGKIGLKDIQSDFSEMVEIVAALCKLLLPENIDDSIKQMTCYIHEMAQQIVPLYSPDLIINTANIISKIAENYSLVYYHPDDMSDEDIAENKEINNKIITEIFTPDKKVDAATNKNESALIMLSPVNNKVLKYLSDNPEALYQLTDRKFEEVMAEIYSKLGYNVELTKKTKDGGKDIIIRAPGILGDFIYYVECKKYAANNPVGVAIVRAFDGVINMDRVNGGIIATTSYFAKDARNLILDKNLSYQIKMHDYNKIREMLNGVV